MGLQNALGGVESGLQGYMQAKTFEQQQEEGKLQIQQDRAKASGPAMLMLQQRLKADPNLIHDAGAINEYNMGAQGLGLPPIEKGGSIDPNFTKYDLFQVIDPQVAAAKEQDKIMKAGTISEQYMNQISHGADPIATSTALMGTLQLMGVDSSTMASVFNDPRWEQATTMYYNNLMATKQSTSFWHTAQGQKAQADTQKILSLLPAQMTQANLNLAYTGKKMQNIDSQIATRAANVQVAIKNALTKASAVNHMLTIGMGKLKLGWAALDETHRKNTEKGWNDALTQARGQANAVLTAAALGVDPDTTKQVMDVLYGDQNTPGLYSQIDTMEQATQGFAAQANQTPYKAPGTPSNTQTKPQQGKVGGYTSYSAQQPMYIAAGPNKGKYTYKGKLLEIDGGKKKLLGTFSPSADNRFQLAPGP